VERSICTIVQGPGKLDPTSKALLYSSLPFKFQHKLLVTFRHSDTAMQTTTARSWQALAQLSTAQQQAMSSSFRCSTPQIGASTEQRAYSCEMAQ